MNSGFNDDLGWASAATPGSSFSPTNFGATTNVSKISGGAAINEEFLDDFDDDDCDTADDFFLPRPHLREHTWKVRCSPIARLVQ